MNTLWLRKLYENDTLGSRIHFSDFSFLPYIPIEKSRWSELRKTTQNRIFIFPGAFLVGASGCHSGHSGCITEKEKIN